ncbi:radical SAM protein [Alkaliphilus pronyensis]|uniref:Heme chaperone HemW n=1 Tax=Alkaliphilus pronyensis TaxID=1482732 RepID=A0A6I0F7R5_9FIRM|nr:coproporphyrinogen-III oxidase family protein [Alkaliphilus pronyensis]KAB3533462.1 radical SAM protein [Alkaliphilus pronyensis]
MFEKRYKSHHDARREFSHLLQTEKSNFNQLTEVLKKEALEQEKEHCIYIHIPFCDKICSFCNMNRRILKGTLDSYVNDIINQIKMYGEFDYLRSIKIGSIYFGGGTPTVLSGTQLEKIINCLKEHFNIIDNCEISTETTLHNLDSSKITKLEEIGFNRLSIGIQTFSDHGRRFLNRTFDKEESINRLKKIREEFSGTVCIDKIYNYSGETLDDLKEDIRIIKELKIDSFSFYSLMIHEGSNLSKMEQSNKLIEDKDREYHDFFVESFINDKELDYDILELTKITLKGKDRYNYIKIRHKESNTIPIGIGAGGKILNYSIYVRDFNNIVVSKNIGKGYTDTHILYGLIQEDKLTYNNLSNHFTKEEIEGLRVKLDELVENQFLMKYEDGYRLTPKGLFYGNNICGSICKHYLENQS